jgi:membrane-associated protein
MDGFSVRCEPINKGNRFQPLSFRPMEMLLALWDLVVHLDRHLAAFVAEYGVWVYALLFAIVFCETGLVVTPFLPGDSLLFTVGALAAAGGMDIAAVAGVLAAAALCGDNVNYWVGRWLGPRLFSQRGSRILDPDHLRRTNEFYARHGGKTLIMARFVPIVRTYAPFVAGLGAMPYGRYISFCVAGAVLWVGSLTLGGYFFGNLPVVKNNLAFVIVGIVAVSVAPMALELLRAWRQRGGAAGA